MGFKPVTARHRPTALTSVLTAVSRRLTLRDSELGLTRPALGADYYLTSLTSVMHREDVVKIDNRSRWESERARGDDQRAATRKRPGEGASESDAVRSGLWLRVKSDPGRVLLRECAVQRYVMVHERGGSLRDRSPHGSRICLGTLCVVSAA
jgi:hypothetical protein